MTTAEIIAEAKARGFRFVETMAGRIPLDQFDPYGTGAGPSARADGTPWTPAELRDIAEGVVSASRRNDAELVAAVKAKAEDKAQ